MIQACGFPFHPSSWRTSPVQRSKLKAKLFHLLITEPVARSTSKTSWNDTINVDTDHSGTEMDRRRTWWLNDGLCWTVLGYNKVSHQDNILSDCKYNGGPSLQWIVGNSRMTSEATLDELKSMWVIYSQPHMMVPGMIFVNAFWP